MSALVVVLLLCVLGGIAGVVAAGAFWLLPARWRERALSPALALAIGALLGASMLGLLPHALAHGGSARRTGAVWLGGVLLFFLVEKLVLWRHCHESGCAGHAGRGGRPDPSGYLILLGDGLHNFVDGVLIGAAAIDDARLGLATAAAVAAHEIPQELGDFAILLRSGMAPRRAFALNLLSGAAAIAGGLCAWLVLSRVQAWMPDLLAVAGAGLLYIALADLVPQLHRHASLRTTAIQLALIATGIAAVALLQPSGH